MFHTLDLTWGRMHRCFYAFSVLEESPAHYVRALRISIEGINWFPDEFLEHAPRFTNVRKLSLFGGEDCLVSRLPSLWRLPESVTSLTIIASNGVSLVPILDIMARLPNLDDLSLRSFVIPADTSALPVIGMVPRGRFGGKLVSTGITSACCWRS